MPYTGKEEGYIRVGGGEKGERACFEKGALS